MKLVWGIVAVLVLAALGYAYFTYGPGVPQGVPSAEENSVNETADTAATEGANGAFTGSIADLLSRGGDWKCTFDVDNQTSHSSGTVYVSGAKVRGDFTSQVPQVSQTVESHMIQNEGYVYVWTPLSPSGFKTKATIGTPDASTKFKGQGVNIDQAYAYDCAPWTADQSLFAPPAGITFMEK